MGNAAAEGQGANGAAGPSGGAAAPLPPSARLLAVDVQALRGDDEVRGAVWGWRQRVCSLQASVDVQPLRGDDEASRWAFLLNQRQHAPTLRE